MTAKPGWPGVYFFLCVKCCSDDGGPDPERVPDLPGRVEVGKRPAPYQDHRANNVLVRALMRWSIAKWLQTGAVTSSGSSSVFAGFRFPPEGDLGRGPLVPAVWTALPDAGELLAERGVTVDHVTIYRWVQRFTPEFAEAARPCRHVPGDRWFVEETYPEDRREVVLPVPRSASTARSSTSCCPRGATWQLPGASSPGRCGPARSRSKSRPTAHPPALGSPTSWSPRPCTPLSSTRIIRSRQTTDGSKPVSGRCVA
jgi:hypothetical protein